MKRWYVLVILIAAHFFPSQYYCIAQQQAFDWPFGDGDRVVIGDTLLRFDLPDDTRDSQYDQYFASTFTVHAYPNLKFLTSAQLTTFLYDGGISHFGNFAIVDYDGYFELLPNAPPQSDTLWLMQVDKFHDISPVPGRYCVNTVEFDTTVFDETVHAFSTDIYKADNTFLYRATIADKYWLIHLATPDGKSASLHRYKIGAKLKNIGPYTCKYPSICSELDYRYEKVVVVGPGYETLHIAPSPVFINDTTYYVGIPELFPGYTFSYPVRSEEGNLYVRENGMERMYHPPQVYLGDSAYAVGSFIGEWLVRIEPGDYMGNRNGFTFVGEYPRNVDNLPQQRVFASGLGFSGAVYHDVFTYTEWSLLEFTHCANDTRVERTEAPSTACISVYPNPVSLRTNGIISIAPASTLPMQAIISIRDALGRQVYSQCIESFAPDLPLSMPVTGFLPGKYFISIDGRNLHATGSFTVLR